MVAIAGNVIFLTCWFTFHAYTCACFLTCERSKICGHILFNTLRPRQNGRNFADDISKCILLNENNPNSINISLKFALAGRINNIAMTRRTTQPWMFLWSLLHTLISMIFTQGCHVNDDCPKKCFDWVSSPHLTAIYVVKHLSAQTGCLINHNMVAS